MGNGAEREGFGVSVHQELSEGFQQFSSASLKHGVVFYCLLQSNVSAGILSQRQSALPYRLTVCVVRITILSVAREFLKHGLGKE